ncbi:endospore germination permease [Tumebacillus sp. ITR2]|uniref:Endospore germination permease n=1 Tax=Tumebacillus amylolyticus TaxID=2801339 RepID=A0ABS1J9J3_9BACL|nr:endospore germination permease [Tumebacillus amylolyticus]MBL0386308.1 endospore germination permease [Tumebacillus amylolyticus]
MKTVQLSLLQTFFLLTAMIISTGHFIFVRIVLIFTGRDGWMVVAPSIVLGSLVLISIIQLLKRFPNQTLIEITHNVFGKWLGRLLTIPYLLFFMAVPALLIRAIGDFLPTTMPSTPYSVMTTVIVVIACITARLGIEVIGRCALLMLPMLVVIGLLASLLTMKDKHYEYLLPMLETSFRGFLRGTATLSGLFAESVVVGMIFLHVPKKKLKTKPILVFFTIIGLMFIGPMTGPVAMFDIESASKFHYPTFEEIRYIQIANFLERLDVLGIVLWTFGTFLKITTFIYALTIGLKQWFGLPDHKPLVFPLAIILLLQSTGIASTRSEVWIYLMKVYPLFTLTVGLLLPWLTLLTSLIRKKGSPADSQESPAAA